MKKLIIIILVFTSFACSAKPIYTADGDGKKLKLVDYFEFNFGNENDGFYEYVIKEDQYYRLSIKTSGNVETHISIDKYINEKNVIELSQLIEDLDLSAWKNFKGKGGNNPEGDSFNLRIAFKDNSYIGAKGFMAFPDDYEEKTKQLIDFLDNLSKKV